MDHSIVLNLLKLNFNVGFDVQFWDCTTITIQKEFTETQTGFISQN